MNRVEDLHPYVQRPSVETHRRAPSEVVAEYLLVHDQEADVVHQGDTSVRPVHRYLQVAEEHEVGEVVP